MSTCCIIGLGYIGLPTAAVLANAGHQVIGVDINQKIVNKINQGLIHIIEPGLEEIVKKTVSNGSLRAQSIPCPADIYLIAVPTPFQTNPNNLPEPNIDYVLDAIKSITPFLKANNLVILESTSPVGTTDKINSLILKDPKINNSEIHVAYCPERVLPGQILNELILNDRVIGGITEKSTTKAKNFYASFCKGTLLTTNSKTAELVKLSENAYRDVNIAFANELSLVADQMDINISDLINLANHHPRVNILSPGCGVGGHCIAVDPWFIASKSPKITPLIQVARKVNDKKSLWVIDQILSEAKALGKKLHRPPIIGCFGLAFKPNVDDLRESPALFITTELISKGLSILVCEPNLDHHDSIRIDCLEKVISESDLLVFLVSHSAFSGIETYKKPILDYCGAFN